MTPQLEMSLQGVRATENPPTASHHLPSIESHNRCTRRDLPSRIVSLLNRNTAANHRSVDHLRVVSVDVTPEVYFARGLANVAASLAAKVSALVDRVVVGCSLAFGSTSFFCGFGVVVDRELCARRDVLCGDEGEVGLGKLGRWKG